MKFKYTAFDKNGKKQKGIIEAQNLKEAKKLLKELTLLDIKPVKNLNFNINPKKINKKELSKLFLTLGLYLKASIPLINAINLTKSQSENNKTIKFLDFLEKEIKEGKNLSTALEKQKIIDLSPYVINTIKVGEESGKLYLVLIEMSKFLKDEDKLLSKTKQALIYPAFIILMSIIMISFMLTVVVPKITKVFSSLHQQLPPITEFIINTSNFLKQNYITLGIIFFIFVLSIVISYKKVYKFRLFIDSLLLKIPVIKKIIISKELGKFSYLAYVLTNSGVNYITAVNLCANTIENEKIKSVFKKAINEVLEGKKLSVSLVKAGFNFDKSFIQALSLAEDTSEVGEILQNISEIYFEENESKINTILSLIEPILIITIGGIIGFIVTAMLLPMFSMNMLK